MTCPAVVVKNKMKELITSLGTVHHEATSIYSVYWKSDATTLVGAVTPDTTAVTVTTKLKKSEFIDGITTCEALKNFFDSAAVSQADYLQNCDHILYGNNPAVAQLSNAVESLGTRMYNLITTCIADLYLAQDILVLWSAHQLDDINEVLNDETYFPEFETNRAVVNAGITLVEQFKKLMSNEAVTTGDYASTVAKWEGVE